MDKNTIYENDLIIQKYIKKNKEYRYTLMMVDFDNISEINKRYSYLFGTALLEEGLDCVMKNIMNIGYIAKIKGDKYVVYFNGLIENKVLNIACNICRDIHDLYSGDDEKVKFTASIGIAMSEYKKNAKVIRYSYNQVLRKCEIVLFQIKRTTKNKAQCYDSLNVKQINESLQYFKKQICDNKINYIKRERNMNAFTMDLLERTKDFDSALKLLLMKVGKAYCLSRIIIINLHNRNRQMKILYMWDSKNDYALLRESPYSVNEKEFEKYIIDMEQNEIMDLDRKKYNGLFNFIGIVNKEIHIPVYFSGNMKGIVIYEYKNGNKCLCDADKKELKQLSKTIFISINRKNLDIDSRNKSEFLSRLSHDIRTPLGIMTGMTDMIRDELRNDSSCKDCGESIIFNYLENIDTAAGYLMGLMNDVLELTRIENGHIQLTKEFFSINDMFDEIMKITGKIAENAGIAMKYINIGNDMNIYGDKLRLSEILINLITNSIRYTDNGGIIEISHSIVSVDETDNTTNIEFMVRDNGIGISKEQIDMIFKPYVRGEELHNTGMGIEGFGLGLSICQNLVRLMGGKVNVKSEPGAGSSFYFTLGFNYSNNSHCISQTNEKKEFDCTGIKVMVVEDNKVNQMVIKHALIKAGCIVEEARTGYEALHTYELSSLGYYNLILMDIRMPGMNGFETAKRIRQLNRDDSKSVIIIATTANNIDEDEVKTYKEQMNGYLMKPFKIREMKQILFDINTIL